MLCAEKNSNILKRITEFNKIQIKLAPEKHSLKHLVKAIFKYEGYCDTGKQIDTETEIY